MERDCGTTTAQQSWLDQASGRRGKLTLPVYISACTCIRRPYKSADTGDTGRPCKQSTQHKAFFPSTCFPSTFFPSAAHDAAASHFFFAAAFFTSAAFFLIPPLAFALPFLPLLLCNSTNFASSSSTLSSSSSSAASLCCADDAHACALGQTSGFDANWSTSELRPNIARHG